MSEQRRRIFDPVVINKMTYLQMVAEIGGQLVAYSTRLLAVPYRPCWEQIDPDIERTGLLAPVGHLTSHGAEWGPRPQLETWGFPDPNYTPVHNLVYPPELLAPLGSEWVKP